MEEITIINIEEKETKMKLNFSMLLAYARQAGGKVIIKIGAYRCLFKVLDEDYIDLVGTDLSILS